MDIVTSSNILALISLTFLEIILGIDNIIFITILTDKLPKEKQALAKNIGLVLAMVMRILLLLSLSWVMKLTTPLFMILGNEISGRDIILIAGGLFLLFKSTHEIHYHVDHNNSSSEKKTYSSYFSVLLQIILFDAIFSLDSVITAIGLAEEISIMVIAIIISMIFMILLINKIGDFIKANPTIKILALSFLLLIGMALIGDGLDMHIPKGYIYFAMGFSIFVELVNQNVRKKDIKVMRN